MLCRILSCSPNLWHKCLFCSQVERIVYPSNFPSRLVSIGVRVLDFGLLVMVEQNYDTYVLLSIKLESVLSWNLKQAISWYILTTDLTMANFNSLTSLYWSSRTKPFTAIFEDTGLWRCCFFFASVPSFFNDFVDFGLRCVTTENDLPFFHLNALYNAKHLLERNVAMYFWTVALNCCWLLQVVM